MRDHRKLEVWRKACDLVVMVYELTSHLPSEERFGLASQLRRAAVSVPSNIAEGSSRASRRDFARFLNLAASSCSEIETQLHLVRRIALLPDARVTPLEASVAEVRRMLSGLIRTVSTT